MMSTKSLFSTCIALSISLSAQLQISQTSTSPEGHSYKINLKPSLAPKTQQIVNDKGEVFVVSASGSYGSLLAITKFNSELEQVKKITLDQRDAKAPGQIDWVTNYLFPCGNAIAVISTRTILYGVHTASVCMIDQDLNIIGEGWNTLCSYYAEAALEETVLASKLVGTYHTNKSGMIGVSSPYLAGENKNLAFSLVRFDSDGNKVYSINMNLGIANEPVTYLKGTMTPDGSFMFFWKQNKQLFYRIISDTGEIFEDVPLEVESDFILAEVIFNEDDEGETFMLCGVDESFYLSLYYVNLSGFDNYENFRGQDIMPINTEDLSGNYISSVTGKFVEDKFYLAAVAWDSSFKEGYKDPTRTSFLGVMLDLADPQIKMSKTIKNITVAAKDYTSLGNPPNQLTNMASITIIGHQMYITLKNYVGAKATEPYESVIYSSLSYRTLYIDVLADKIVFKNNVVRAHSKVKDQGYTGYYFTRDSDPAYKTTPIVLKKESNVMGEIQTESVLHISDKIPKKVMFSVINFLEDENGDQFIYGILSGEQRSLVKIPIPNS
jgi:hypothetical protein